MGSLCGKSPELFSPVSQFERLCFALCDVSFTDVCVGAGDLHVSASCLLNGKDIWKKMEGAAHFLPSSHRIFCGMQDED